MEVKIVSTTEPNSFLCNNSEELIAYCARVSNPENQHNKETAPRLLKFLIKYGHWSPFEMVDMTVEIKTSRAIAAQILRHRSFSFQEFSQRYSEVANIEHIELRKQAENNRQSSEDVIEEPVINNVVKHSVETSVMTYNKLLTQGVAKEVARLVLPLAAESTLYMKGSIRSWIHYIDLRTQQNTQKEHRLIAEECKEILSANFPTVAEALEWNE